MAKKDKPYKYVPPPVLEVSVAEALAREKLLREQINMWPVYPRDTGQREEGARKESAWPQKSRPGIARRITEMVRRARATLLPVKAHHKPP